MKKEIIFCGDFAITDTANTDQLSVEKELVDLFTSSNLNVVNLECPVTSATKQDKIVKTGPHLKGNSSIIEGNLKLLNVDLVTLANNHILDYGAKGLKDTLNFCKKNNLKTVGAGVNLESAKKVFTKDLGTRKISIINIAENEWSSASEETPGANPLNVIDNSNQIKEEKEKGNTVILVIHGGHEYYNLPSPRMVKLYRFYASCGADLIVGHHPHCISGYEVYNGTPIYYSLGNFIFTKKSRYNDWYQGLLLKIKIDSFGKIETELFPCEQDKVIYSLKLLKGEAKTNFINKFDSYSKVIQNNSLLNKAWQDYIEQKSNSYLGNFSLLSFVNNKYIKILLNKTGLISMFVFKSILIKNLNLIRCEAHSDLLKSIIEKKINENSNT